MIVDRTKEPIVAGVAVGELEALAINACIVGAFIVVLAIRISQTLHAGVSIFIAQKIWSYGASISAADAMADDALIGGGAELLIVAFRVVRLGLGDA